MKKFILDQSNTGGVFLEGMPRIAVIIADTEEDACAQARDMGVDFMDYCECCGVRWNIAAYDEQFHGDLDELLASREDSDSFKW
jgi:alkanesulfonate monooxygenase SsuD/methylene tetrahydromethanopterin reductase-like flavin-dependent oxidoreductase (luciferase family)